MLQLYYFQEQRSQRGKGLLKRKMASPISGASSSKSKEKMYLLSDVCEEYMDATVEELLAAAYLNILNSSSNSSMQGGSEPIEHSEFSSDYVDPKEEQEMVEEFLDSSYKNLLNHFNEKENLPQGNCNILVYYLTWTKFSYKIVGFNVVLSIVFNHLEHLQWLSMFNYYLKM
jgi:hypothetical protein